MVLSLVTAMTAAPAELESTNAEANTAKQVIRKSRLIAQINRPSNGLALGGKKPFFEIEKTSRACSVHASLRCNRRFQLVI